METYKDHKPTGLDRHINLPERDDWLIVAFHTRESDNLEESNWQVFMDKLSPAEGLANLEQGSEEAPAEVHRFGHWACGWYEVILVKPNSWQEAVAKDLWHSLEDYPLLNEEDYCQRCFDDAVDAWNDLSPEEKQEAWEEENVAYHGEHDIPPSFISRFY